MKFLARDRAGAAAIVALVLSGALPSGEAAAQSPPPAEAPPPAAAAAPAATSPLGGNSKSPVDVHSDELEVIQPQHVYIYTGNVEAIQDDARLRSPKIFVYTKEKPTGGAAKAASPMGPDMGNVDHMDAEGPVYYVTPTQNARGDHGHWDANTDTITLDGNVVLAQGKSVGKGDHLIMNRKTGVSHLTSDHPNTPSGRIRTILYPQQQTAAAAPAAPPSAAGKPQ